MTDPSGGGIPAATAEAGDGFVRVSGLTKIFPGGSRLFSRNRRGVRAVDRVSFTIDRGEVMGLVGESGSGKTTIGRCLVRLMEPTSGTVLVDGMDVMRLSRRDLTTLRRTAQIVFQDPYSSLNPRLRVGSAIREVLLTHRIVTPAEADDRVAELFTKVGLDPGWADRYPHQFSGGQRQRISIARALALNPAFIVADEPVSALDVSIQAQILNLLMDLQEEFSLTVLFISHDLSAVRDVCDRIAVLYLGRIMEIGPTRELIASPAHPYTRALFSAAPVADPTAVRKRITLEGELPDPASPPSGCVFRTRCADAVDDCSRVVPELRAVAKGHSKACIRDDI